MSMLLVTTKTASMHEDDFYRLIRFLAEETAHHRFGEDGVNFNIHTGECEFTEESERFIHNEMSVLEMTFNIYGLRPKESWLNKIKRLLGIID